MDLSVLGAKSAVLRTARQVWLTRVGDGDNIVLVATNNFTPAVHFILQPLVILLGT